MNPQDQLIEIAKLDGFTPSKEDAFRGWFEHKESPGFVIERANLPDYLRSRDAIVPVIEKQSEDVKYFIALHLVKTDRGGLVWDRSVINAVLATPAQLCEALLRATGKWKE